MEAAIRLLRGALRIELETAREYSKLSGKGSRYFTRAAAQAMKKIPDYAIALHILKQFDKPKKKKKR